MSTYRFDRLFEPRSIALLGASPREKSVGRTDPEKSPRRRIRRQRSAGESELRRDRRASRRSRASTRCRWCPDVAVIASPPPTVPEAVATLAAKGCAAAVIITSGLGHGPGSLAEATRQAAHAHGMRLIGPNCLGILIPRAKLNATFTVRMPLDGDLALISQSGAIAAGLIEWAAQRQVGFSAMVSVGDMVDVDFGDLLDFFAFDRRTRAILLYIEADPRCAQVHVGGARRRAHQADRRGQGGTARARGQGGAHAHRCAGRLRCGLRRGVPPRRAAAGERSRRTVRRGRDAGAVEAVSRAAACDPHQRRRHRRAGGRSAGRSRRHAGGISSDTLGRARCGDAADLVARQPGRHHRRCRCRAL